jgi:threonine synthase
MTCAKRSKVMALACLRCGADHDVGLPLDSRGCPRCYPQAPANFGIRYTQEARAARAWTSTASSPGLARRADFLPVEAEDFTTLQEGDTPLIAAARLGASLGVAELYLKDEGRNPTWSHKDRFSAVAVAYARRIGAATLATASSGNAGASLAAYAAKANLPCVALTFEKAVGPMVEQMRRYGAMVLPLPRPEDRWPLLAEGVRRFGWFPGSPFAGPVVGSHPIGIEGYKTIAFEIVEQLGRVPDWVVIPTAYGDVLSGVLRGFQDLVDLGVTARLPRMAAAEIHGSLDATIRTGGDRVPQVRKEHETRAVSIGVAQSSYQALAAVRRSGGAAVKIPEDQLLEWQARLAREEGVLSELSSAAAVAGAAALRRDGVITPADTVVCVLTASGLKDLTEMPRRAQGAADLHSFENALAFLQREYGFAATPTVD